MASQAARRAGADRAGLSLAVAVGHRARPGQGDDPRPRRQEGRGDDDAAARCAVRQRLDPREADGIRRSRGAVVVARLCPAQRRLPLSAIRDRSVHAARSQTRHPARAPRLARSRTAGPARAAENYVQDHARTRRTQSADRRREGLSRGARRDRRHRCADRRSRHRSPRCAAWRKPSATTLRGARRRAGAEDPRRAAAEGRDGRAQRRAGNPRRHRRRRGLAVRRRPVPDV